MTHELSLKARQLCEKAPVIPVLVVKDVSHATSLAKALVTGGLHVLEVTLRTPAALDVIRVMKEQEGAIVGAGTVLSVDDLKAAKDAGAEFVVSPGFTDALLDVAEDIAMPILPGATTPAEIMHLSTRGYDMLKYFPAETNGGASALKSLASPFAKISFCPTGGVNPNNVQDYLSLPNVVCVGGSWVAPNDAIQSDQWSDIESLAQKASQLPR